MLRMKVELVNFNTYIYYLGTNPQLYRWVLLNQTFKEIHPKHSDLISRSKNDTVYFSLY